jgi:hypothetical protein
VPKGFDDRAYRKRNQVSFLRVLLFERDHERNDEKWYRDQKCLEPRRKVGQRITGEIVRNENANK